MPPSTGSSLSISHLLFLLGGFLLGMSIGGLTYPAEPNVTLVAGTAVVGLCTLIAGQQSAEDRGGSSSEQ